MRGTVPGTCGDGLGRRVREDQWRDGDSGQWGEPITKVHPDDVVCRTDHTRSGD
ncbi:MAG TPA: hypothetical protein VEF72_04050 [Mycobacterium sp.]|nr:hypothetical protein [Mycobacterium sp.]